jgi:hypothetical protein
MKQTYLRQSGRSTGNDSNYTLRRCESKESMVTSGDKKDDEELGVSSGRELRELYELTAANKPAVRLSGDRVPPCVRGVVAS